MNTFFYLLKGILFLSQDNVNEQIIVNEVFENDNPIEARDQVFEAYNNCLDLLSKNKDKNKKTRQLIKYKHYDGASDLESELRIYLIMKESKTDTTPEDELIYENKLLISDLHSDWDLHQKVIFSNLEIEYSLYQQFGYDCKDYTVKKEINEVHYTYLKLPRSRRFIIRVHNNIFSSFN